MQFVVFEKFIRVLIYPKLHAKNLVNTCKNLTFSSLRVTACHRSLLQPTNDTFDPDNGQNFGRWILKDKNAETRNLFTENWFLLSFYVINFSCFSTTATERNTTATKIPLLCFIYLGFGWGKRHNGGFIDGFFVVHAGWGGNLTDFNFPRFCKKKKLNSLLLSANERSEIFATCRHFDLKSIIWSQSTASHLFARKRSFHRPTSSSLLARWHLMITITSYLHTL